MGSEKKKKRWKKTAVKKWLSEKMKKDKTKTTTKLKVSEQQQKHKKRKNTHTHIATKLSWFKDKKNTWNKRRILQTHAHKRRMMRNVHTFRKRFYQMGRNLKEFLLIKLSANRTKKNEKAYFPGFPAYVRLFYCCCVLEFILVKFSFF